MGNNINIETLLTMCRSDSFDKQKAYKLIQSDVNINEPYQGSLFLIEAAESSNYDAVQFLLELHADPNKIVFNESALQVLQYTAEDAEEDEVRLKITQLLLEYGADPNLYVDGDPICGYADTYDFFDAYLIKPFSTYRKRFCDLLFRYGGLTLEKYYCANTERSMSNE